MRICAPLLLFLALLALGCGGVHTYGDMSREAVDVDLAGLLDAPELHLGQAVRVAGPVAQVCQEMGCWFEIASGDRRLMIDLQMGTGFTVPEGAAGMWAIIVGPFVREDGVLKIMGRGVELHERRPS
jgi:hypothetical protein